MDSVEAEGNSIDEAIDSALKVLGTTRDRVDIEILSNSARGLFGLGGRKARVRATPRRPIDADVAAAPLAPEPVANIAARSGAASAPAADESAGRAADVLREIARLMEVETDVVATHQDESLVLELTGDTSGVLIGRRGQMLDALEYVLNRIVSRDLGTSERIVVDSQNYRARRRDALEELARRMAAQAKKKQRPVTLNPMSPRDRRIVHLALQADPSLSTRSSGNGYFRKLIIFPGGTAKAMRAAGPQGRDSDAGE